MAAGAEQEQVRWLQGLGPIKQTSFGSTVNARVQQLAWHIFNSLHLAWLSYQQAGIMSGCRWITLFIYSSSLKRWVLNAIYSFLRCAVRLHVSWRLLPAQGYSANSLPALVLAFNKRGTSPGELQVCPSVGMGMHGHGHGHVGLGRGFVCFLHHIPSRQDDSA